MLLDWVGDIVPLLTGSQCCKPAVTGNEGWSVPAGDCEKVFFPLQQKEVYICMSCDTNFYLLSLWQIYHTLIFLACRVLSIFYGRRLSWKDPWKPLPPLKVSELQKERLDRLTFLFFGEWNQEWGGKENAQVDEKSWFLKWEDILQKCYQN